MADELPLGFQTEFDARVVAAYQQSAVMMNKVYEKKNVTGKYCQFRRRGKGSATPHVRNAPVTPLNLGLDVVTAELSDWDAAERLDPFDLKKINWDDQRIVAESLGMAVGRRHDQIIINAIEADVNQTVAVDYGSTGTNTALNVKKINHAAALMNYNAVPPMNRYGFISAYALEGALNDQKIGSQEYNILKALYEGSLTKYSGFEFTVIANNDEGGLPISGNIRSCYFIQQDAVGYAEGLIEGMDGRVKMDWSPDYQGWLLCAKLSAGAKVIETAGVVEVLVDESKAAA